jgi:hypothetical protein
MKVMMAYDILKEGLKRLSLGFMEEVLKMLQCIGLHLHELCCLLGLHNSHILLIKYFRVNCSN